jgi:RNA polymerase sigma-70 factor (ECF subfamily)
MTVLTEVECVQRAQQGEVRALETLWKAHRENVTSALQRAGVPWPDVEDVAQEVWLLALQRLQRLEHPEAFHSWLLEMARRTALAYHRKQKRPVPLEALEEDFRATATVASAEATFLDQEALDVVHQAVLSVSLEDRAILVLRYWDGWHSRDVAQRLSMSVDAVDQRLSRLRKRLRDALTPYFQGTGSNGPVAPPPSHVILDPEQREGEGPAAFEQALWAARLWGWAKALREETSPAGTIPLESGYIVVSLLPHPDWTWARAVIEELAREHPEPVWLRAYLSVRLAYDGYHWTGRYADVLALCGKVLREDREAEFVVAEAAHTIGASLLHWGRCAEAYAQFRRVQQDYARFRNVCVNSQFLIGWGQGMHEGKWEEALASAREVFARYPEQTWALPLAARLAATCWERIGDSARWEQGIEEFLALVPDESQREQVKAWLQQSYPDRRHGMEYDLPSLPE